MTTHELNIDAAQFTFGYLGNLGEAENAEVILDNEEGYPSINFALAVPSGGTVVFEGSYDGSTYFRIAFKNLDTKIFQREATADGNFTAIVQGLRKIRVRVSVAGSSAGSVIGTATKNTDQITTANNDEPSVFWVKHAQEEIYNTYGDIVRIKPKSLFKFGRIDALGTTEETVWLRGGKETLATTNAIDTISSSGSGDTGDVTIEGHTVDGSGNLTFVVQSATLNGQNKVVLSTPIARATRIFNNDGTDFAGTVYVYEDDTVTAGVPQTTAKIHLQTDGGNNQSLKAATSFSQFDYGIITHVTIGVTRQNSRSVDFKVKVAEKGKVFRTKLPPLSGHSTSGMTTIPIEPHLIVPPNADIRIDAISSGADTGAGAGFNSLLGLIQT